MDKDPIPKKIEVEAKVQFETPKNTLVVRLPFIWGDMMPGTGQVALGMHTDMLGTFVRALDGLKETTRDRLLIEGRHLTRKQENRLDDNPVYRFFWDGRAIRRTRAGQEEVIRVLLPKKTELTDQDIKRYTFMRFSPESLKKQVGYRVAWFPANKLLKMATESHRGANALDGILGAVNEFRIGSKSLSYGMLRMISGRISSAFSLSALVLIGNANVWENRALSVALRVVDLKEEIGNLFRK